MQRLYAGGDELFGVGDAGGVDGLLGGGAGGLVALGEFGFEALVLGLEGVGVGHLGWGCLGAGLRGRRCGGAFAEVDDAGFGFGQFDGT